MINIISIENIYIRSACLLFILILASISKESMAIEPGQKNENASIKSDKKLIERKQFDAWDLKCFTGEITKERCLIGQSITGKKGKARLVYITVSYTRTSSMPVVTFYLPLGISLVPGIIYKTNARNKLKLPLRVCSNEGCMARKMLDKKSIAALKEGKELNVSFVIDKNRRTISLNASLTGFSQAFAALSAKSK